MERLGAFFARVVQRWLPDPMVLACALSLMVVGIAFFAPATPDLSGLGPLHRTRAIAQIWLDGLWDAGFLAFALRIGVVLLTGYGLAQAPPVMRAIHALAGRVRTNRQAVMLVTAVSCAGCWLNWGFGLIVAGILAGRLRDELVNRGIRCHETLLAAGAYTGMMVWHGGLSGSAPLKVAQDGVVIAAGAVTQTVSPIDIAQTILSPANLVLAAALLIGVPFLLRSMTPARDEPAAAAEGQGEVGDTAPSEAERRVNRYSTPDLLVAHAPADYMNRTRVVPILIAAIAVTATVHRIVKLGAVAVDLDFVNTVFLTIGLLLHRNLMEYVTAVARGGQALTAIVLQFPLYAGIQALMQKAGIAAAISQAFVAAAHWSSDALAVPADVSLPIATLLSAGLVNVFIPSGGGQWIVQGPIMCAAAATLDVPMNKIVLAVAYGDEWTNMIQPFWALPLMGLTGVNVRRFMGYCALLMLLATPAFVLALLF